MKTLFKLGSKVHFSFLFIIFVLFFYFLILSIRSLLSLVGLQLSLRILFSSKTHNLVWYLQLAADIVLVSYFVRSIGFLF